MKFKRILASGFGYAISQFGAQHAGDVNNSLLEKTFYIHLVSSVNDAFFDEEYEPTENEAQQLLTIYAQTSDVLKGYKGDSLGEAVSLLSSIYL